MAEALQYIVNESGDKTSVLVPVKVWEQLNEDYRKLQNKLAVFASFQSGLDEIKQAKKQSKSLQTLKDFLA